MATTITDPQLYPGWTTQGQTGDEESSGNASTAALSSLGDSNKDPQLVTGWNVQTGSGDDEHGAGVDATTLTTPTIPSSGTALANTTGSPVQVYITAGGSGTLSVAIEPYGGSSYTTIYTTLTSGTQADFSLSMGMNVKLTYTSAPTWIWTPGI